MDAIKQREQARCFPACSLYTARVARYVEEKNPHYASSRMATPLLVLFHRIWRTGINFMFAILVAALRSENTHAADGDVRLVDGSLPTQGRVEVQYGGEWWTVCQNGALWGDKVLFAAMNMRILMI